MYSTRISENLYPCDSKPTSIAATSSIVVAVVAAILTGIAYYLNWGLLAICSCAAISGLASIVAIALIFCKKSSPETLPEHGISSDPPLSDPIPSEQSKKMCRELYTLIKKGDVAMFKETIRSYDKPSLFRLCNSRSTAGNISLDPDDETTSLEKSDKISYQFLNILLNQKDEAKKIAFLKSLFENVKDHEVYELQENQYAFPLLLEIQSQELIDLLFKKLNGATLSALVDLAFTEAKKLSKAKGCLVWLETFFDKWQKDQEIQKKISKEFLCLNIILSNLEPTLKLKYFTIVAAQTKDTLETFEIDETWYFQKTLIHGTEILPVHKNCEAHTQKCNLLHFAIECANFSKCYDVQNLDFIRALAATAPSLVNKPIIIESNLTLLLRAVLHGNREIIQILLDAKANPDAHLTNNIFIYSREGASKITPLMIAARMGKQGIVDALVKAGADPDLKDGADDDPKAWTMKDYEEKYKIT